MKKIALALFASIALLAGCSSAPKVDPVATNVEAALKKDEFTKKFDIKAANADGTVTLTGNVDNEFQQWYSGTVAQKIDGVKKVDNKVKVQ